MWSWKKNLRRQRPGIVLIVSSKDCVSRITPESSSQQDQKYGKLEEEYGNGILGDGAEKRRHRLGVVGSLPDLSKTVGAERIELVALKPALEFVLVPVHRVVWYVTALVVVNELMSHRPTKIKHDKPNRMPRTVQRKKALLHPDHQRLARPTRRLPPGRES